MSDRIQYHLPFITYLIHLFVYFYVKLMASYPKNISYDKSSYDKSKKMEYSNFGNDCNRLMKCQQNKINAASKMSSALHVDKRKDFQQDDDFALKSAIANGHVEEVGTAVNEETVRMCKSGHDKNGLIVNGKHDQNGSIANETHAENGSTVIYEHAQNGIASDNAKSVQTAPNGKSVDATEELQWNYSKSGVMLNASESNNDEINPNSKNHGNSIMRDHRLISSGTHDSSCFQNGKRQLNSVVVNNHLTADDLQSLFTDQICVLHIPNYVPQAVCDKLDSFLQERGCDQYTHEIRSKDGTANLQYFGVNRYGFPLNSTYNDSTGNSLKRYFSEALPTMQSLRTAAAPYLSPIDKLRVELDELWYRNVNVATLNGRKTFCGIGRIMPAILSELSADQPHFDAVPTSYFPNIHKQFSANIYLNVPEVGGELEIWDVPPVDVDNVENFTIPENWRSKLPGSITVKPDPGDLLLLNTRRPHAITKFTGTRPRTSIQSFIGLTKESDVFLWV